MAKKEEKICTFESETLALPPLKMVLTGSDQRDPLTRKKGHKPEEQIGEDVVKRLIDKLTIKE